MWATTDPQPATKESNQYLGEKGMNQRQGTQIGKAKETTPFHVYHVPRRSKQATPSDKVERMRTNPRNQSTWRKKLGTRSQRQQEDETND
ncbi:hypothetical protein CLCR_09308 [Cladophialophora carrionii]|uniref:Uncharacterized protein n=1 Tax=Cladophialophora carrionii TaxID=86049 RepID=A0A1C1CTP6_9EURO|nr:hypothetical protein CLCR_09308 [Cladophialophora carrionii]